MKSMYQTVHEMELANKAGALCTIIQSSGSTPRHQGSKMLVYEDGSFSGTVGGGEVETRVINEALEAIKTGKPRQLEYHMVDPAKGDPGICGGTLVVYVEPILPKPVVLVIGGGHVGKCVAHLAKWLGFHVVISDDRPEFCTKEIIPDGDEFLAVPMEKLGDVLHFNSQTYIILTTRGAVVDIEGLPELLKQPFAYMGIIGSRRRWTTTTKAILEKGVSAEQLARIHSPIGLELNAETPEEIAVSIMSEIIMLRNGGSGKSMKITG